MDGHFTGYASLFGVPDTSRDVVVPGASETGLRERRAVASTVTFTSPGRSCVPHRTGCRRVATNAGF